MLKNTELRIGNYVAHKGNIFTVRTIEDESIIAAELTNNGNSGTFHYDEIEGVPFSQRILENHGWIRVPQKGDNYYRFNGKSPAKLGEISGLLDIEFPYDGGPLARVWTFQDRTKEDNPGTATLIRYFHELQNLIFGLLIVELADLL